ncbi:MAG: Gfo/Idh/MocA family oxidoreductase [Bacteroidales bacterium]|nr:Gfo/Idh/MocA family oxidoreductase [Bacteroidales bacterium]
MDIAVIGAGNRARKYLSCIPGEVHVRYIVEPEPLRLSSAAKTCGVPPENCFTSVEEFFSRPRDIRAVIVATPDKLHVPVALEAVRHGYHVLLEKPVAQTLEEYMTLLEASLDRGVQVGVCLEMRFHPYFRRMKEIVDSGVLGDLMEIDHTEHIGPDRMAHTFVRGLWSRSQDAGPIFLSKCCHDADFLMWLSGGTVVSASSQGLIRKFRTDRAPYGATARCLDCPVADCPYSAVQLYQERREWVDGFDVPSGSTIERVLLTELASGRYGRCVYRCDNTVYDTQDVEAVLSNGVQLHMHLEGTSMKEGRTTVISGSKATLSADGGHIQVSGPDGTILLKDDYSHLAGLPLHAGADRMLVEDFFNALSSGTEPHATLASAIEGHRLCYLAG